MRSKRDKMRQTQSFVAILENHFHFYNYSDIHVWLMTPQGSLFYWMKLFFYIKNSPNHHPRTDPLQFLGGIAHSKLYIATLHIIF